jgi:excinuclease ABC subunit A
MVDQSAIGRTPRSNPAVYIGAFDSLRDLFAESELAKQRGMNSSAFSFNSSQGPMRKMSRRGL